MTLASQERIIPSHDDVLAHFKRNLRSDALHELEEGFKNYWKAPVPVKSPEAFHLEIKFSWRLQDDIKSDVQNTLAEAGWKNYEFIVKENGDYVLDIRLDEEQAKRYSR